jgi:hypothetical protein
VKERAMADVVKFPRPLIPEYPWRDDKQWAEFCEMYREICIIAEDLMFAAYGDHVATVATRLSPDEWRPKMKDVADALEDQAEMLRRASGYEVERISPDSVG